MMIISQCKCFEHQQVDLLRSISMTISCWHKCTHYMNDIYEKKSFKTYNNNLIDFLSEPLAQRYFLTF